MREISVMFVMLAMLAMASSAANARDHQQFGTSKKTSTSTTAVPTNAKPRPPRICADFNSRTNCRGTPYRVVIRGVTLRRHRGIDFRAPTGTPVIASGYGTVRSAEPTSYGDGLVSVSTNITAYHRLYGNSWTKIEYAHIVPAVRVGDAVEPGDVIGYIDSKRTRCSSFSHVHLQLMIRGMGENAIDPNDFWADGPGQVTCYQSGVEIPRDKLVAPLRCN